LGITQRILMANFSKDTIIEKIGRLVLALLVCTLPGVCLATENLGLYPGAELVESRVDEKIESRRIILGALKKINNELQPKFFEYVTGTQTSNTYYIPTERRIDKLVEFYLDQLSGSSRILFRCEGRDCGSSNYWANTVFTTPLLYGPEQFQNYIIARDLATDDYIAIYVGQRGTKKIYVHVQIISGIEKQPKLTMGTLFESFESHHRFVIQTSNFVLERDLVEDLVEFMKLNEPSKLTLVSHDSLQKSESIEEGMQRTLRYSESVRSALVDAGISKERIQAFGVGPLSPLDDVRTSRLEFLLIDER
jgi:hypothetical protein